MGHAGQHPARDGTRSSLLAVGLAVLLLAGCGSGPAADATADPSQEPLAAPEPGPTPAPGAEPTGLAAPADETWEPWGKGRARTDLAARVAVDGSAGFTAAAGSVVCVAGPDGERDAVVRCDREQGPEQLGVDQPQPPACEGTWGDAVAVTTGSGGRLLCVTDSFLDHDEGGARGPELAEGEAVRYRGLTCTSRGDAVQCLDAAARGFVVSPRLVVVR